MKRVKNIYDKISDYKNLELATRFASLGKKSRRSVIRFFYAKEQKLKNLQKFLETETYHPFPYSKKTIMDRCTNKIREIFVPKFYPDQIVQWALMLQIKPIFMKGMYDFSCASVDGRGASLGIKMVKRWLECDKVNTKYCLVCDIRKFYPSINQDILLKKIEKKIKDKKTLNLIEKIVKSVEKGVPIGNYTSQWFANFYLQDFDHFVKESLRIKYYVRYMDDLVFFGSNKKTLKKQFFEIKRFLQNEKLEIKPNWQIFKIAKSPKSGRPLDFLGYKFYRNCTLLRSKTFLRMRRRFKKIASKDYLTAKDASAALSYQARIKVTSGNLIYKKIVDHNVNLGKCRWTISRHDRLDALNKKHNTS